MKSNLMTSLSWMPFGLALIGYMSCTGNIEKLSIMLLTIYSYVFIKYIKKTRIILMVLGIVLGFLLGSYCLFYFQYDVVKGNTATDIKEKKNTAVLLIFDGEPPAYDLPIFLKNIAQTKDIIYKIRAPFELYDYKKAYDILSKSRYIDISTEIGEGLSKHLNYGYDVFIGYFYSRGYYDEILRNKILQANYKKVIIVPIYIESSLAYQKIVQAVEEESSYFSDCLFKIMSPLWDSNKIANGIVQKICTKNDSLKTGETGIILLNSCKAENIEGSDKRLIKQEQFFIKELKNNFINNGFESRKIKLANLRSPEKEITYGIEELRQYGIKKIYVISPTDIEEKLAIQYKIEKLIRKWNGLGEIEIEHIKGWGIEEGLIEELEYKIRMLNIGEWILYPGA